MPTFIEKNAAQVETWIDDRNGDPGIDIHYRQDVEPIVNYATAMRNDEEVTRRGMKEDWLPYASIPPVEIMRMRFEDGVDIFNPNDQKKLFQLLNTRYTKLKLTTKVHRPK